MSTTRKARRAAERAARRASQGEQPRAGALLSRGVVAVIESGRLPANLDGRLLVLQEEADGRLTHEVFDARAYRLSERDSSIAHTLERLERLMRPGTLAILARALDASFATAVAVIPAPRCTAPGGVG